MRTAITRRALPRLSAACLLLITLAAAIGGRAQPAAALSPDVVISQVYGGGGNTGATLRNDFIELFNRGGSPISLVGWSVQYTSSGGSTWQVTSLAGSIAPGGYYLVQQAQGSGGTLDLPTPDAVGTIPLSGSSGKVALVASTTALSGACPAGSPLVDLVGYGETSCAESAPTPALSSTTAATRNDGGCSETDNNGADFSVGAPNPRNSATAASLCSTPDPALGTQPQSQTITPGATASFSVSATGTPPLSYQWYQGSSGDTSSPIAQATGADYTTPALSATTSYWVRVTNGNGATADSQTATITVADLCAAADTPIGRIQGAGAGFDPAFGGVQTVQGVVVGDYEYRGSGSANLMLRGFYLQNPPDGDDDNPASSDGIFIFNGNNNSVALGEVVQVSGAVGEFNFSTVGGTQTQISADTIEVCGAGSITPTELSLPLAGPEALEAYEGMLVRFAQPLYVTEHFQLGRFGQVVLSGGGRLSQPTNVAAPGAAAGALQAQNDLNKLYVDDDLQAQNPDPIRLARGGQPLSAANTLRGGDSVTGLVGVLGQTDATPTDFTGDDESDPVRYRLRVLGDLSDSADPSTADDAPSFQAANPRPATPATANGRLRVVSFNLLNYFNTFDGLPDNIDSCTLGVGGGATDCRGADTAAEFERQWPKTIAAILATGADVLLVNELENDGYGAASAIQHLVDRLNSATAPGTWAFVDADAATGQTNALGDDAIKVAILYKPGKVTLVGATAALNSGAFGRFDLSSGPDLQRNRPSLAQAFSENSSGERVIVVANHLKSKGSGCEDNVSPVGPDPDVGDGQGNCNLTRAAAAAQLVDWLATDPTGTGDPDVLIAGDLNSYAQEDPVTAIARGADNSAGSADDYVNLIATRLGADAYSYVFDGQWGYLDHALASRSLSPQVAAVAEYHINADEPGVLDYNTNFKTASLQTTLYAADAFRTSDHDPVIVGLSLGEAEGTLVYLPLVDLLQ